MSARESSREERPSSEFSLQAAAFGIAKLKLELTLL